MEFCLYMCVTWWTEQQTAFLWSKPETQNIFQTKLKNINTAENSLRLLVSFSHSENDPVEVKFL